MERDTTRDDTAPEWSPGETEAYDVSEEAENEPVESGERGRSGVSTEAVGNGVSRIEVSPGDRRPGDARKSVMVRKGSLGDRFGDGEDSPGKPSD